MSRRLRMNMTPTDSMFHHHGSRDTLHKKHMEEFLEFAKTKGYEVLPSPPQAIYEVGRIKMGTNKPIIFFAREKPTEHVTVPYGAIDLVSDFYSWRKGNGKPLAS